MSESYGQPTNQPRTGRWAEHVPVWGYTTGQSHLGLERRGVRPAERECLKMGTNWPLSSDCKHQSPADERGHQAYIAQRGWDLVWRR